MKRIVRSVPLNQDCLKIYALAAMTADHFAQIYEPSCASVLRTYIGRTAFPVFSFLIMYHLAKKQIFKKYIVRLSVFAVITSLALFPFKGVSANIFFTFLFPIVTLLFFKNIKEDDSPAFVKGVMYFFCVSFLVVPALYCPYSFPGYFYLIGLYFMFLTKRPALYGLVLTLSFCINMDPDNPVPNMLVSFLTTVFMMMADFEKSARRLIGHWSFFYAYYPVHLFVLYALKSVLGG